MKIDIHSGAYRCCDGVTRRSFLKTGALMLGGMSLSSLLRQEAMAAAAGKTGKDLSVILFWQGGGPSQLDMWDMKPDAPSEFRGSFNPIRTNLPGYQVCEHMPRIAKVCDKLAILRSVTHGDAGHESASHTLLTGYKPTNDIPANENSSAPETIHRMLMNETRVTSALRMPSENSTACSVACLAFSAMRWSGLSMLASTKLSL